MNIQSVKRFTAAKQHAFDVYYKKLNEMQRRSVYTVNGPLLILAGAGTGKTTVLVNRIAQIINFGDAYFSDLMPDDVTEEELTYLENAEAADRDELSAVLTRYANEPCPASNILAITFTNKAANEMKERITGVVGEEKAKKTAEKAAKAEKEKK